MLIISATNRPGSNTYFLAKLYQEWLQVRGEQPELIDLCNLPEKFVFNALYEKVGTDPDFNSFQKKIDNHQQLLFIVPEYNGSFPGILKCFLDGLRYPGTLEGKKIAFTGLSSGPLGGAVAISHLTDIMHYYNSVVLPVFPRLAFVDSELDRDKKEIHNPVFLKLAKQQLDQLIGE